MWLQINRSIRKDHNRKIFSIVAIFLFIFLFAYANWNGLSLTFDSLNYVSAAVTFSSEGIMKESSGELYVHYPPLYPFLLSFFPEHIKEFALFINFFSLAISLLLWLRIGNEIIKDDVLYLVFSLTLAFSTPWILVGHFIWSEAFFILLVTLYSFYLLIYLKNNQSSPLIYASIAGFLMPFQRTAAVFILAGAYLYLLIHYVREGKNIKHYLLHIFFSISGFLFITISTKVIDVRVNVLHPSMHFEDFMNQAYLNLVAVGNLIFPVSLSEEAALFAALLLFSIIIWFACVYFNSTVKFLVTVLGFYFLSFTILPVIFSFGSIDELDRYFSVIYPFFFLIIIVFLDSLKLIKFRKAVYLLLFIWLLYPSVRTIKNSVFFHERQEIKTNHLNEFSLSGIL